ncbi:MAG: ribosome assembly factor SBDS [Nanoarchaeota archaeon]|nr:ribosome assembly factor SBDS [Nanoarchaeota archaeon]
MVNVDKAIIARIKKGGETFEILVDCDKALSYREGTLDSLDDVLATEDIFSDVKQGEHASENTLKKIFHTEDQMEIIKVILKEGEIQLTADHKNKLRDEKKKQIVQFIHRNAINPTSGAPHPIDRINNAMEEAKVKIDEFKKAEDQVQDVISKLRPLIPLKIEVRELEIVIPSEHAGNAYNVLQRFAKVLKSDWLNNGGLKALIEIPAGIQEELENELGKMTKGDFELKILNKR